MVKPNKWLTLVGVLALLYFMIRNHDSFTSTLNELLGFLDDEFVSKIG
jgi:hypothetical protein